MTVKVASVNLDDRQIDLLMVDEEGRSQRRKGRSKSKPLTARERVNIEGARRSAKAQKPAGKGSAKSKSTGASAKSKSTKAAGNAGAKKPKAAKRVKRKK